MPKKSKSKPAANPKATLSVRLSTPTGDMLSFATAAAAVAHLARNGAFDERLI